jgi:hypothetical protein
MDPREANTQKIVIRQLFMYIYPLRKARIEQWAPADEGSRPGICPSFSTFGNKSKLKEKGNVPNINIKKFNVVFQKKVSSALNNPGRLVQRVNFNF